MKAKDFTKRIFENIKRNWYLPVTEYQVYSTEEQVIGVWTDGKPLYEKTVNIGAVSTVTLNFVHGIENIENVIHYDGIYQRKDGTFYKETITNPGGVSEWGIGSFVTKTYIYIRFGTNYTGDNAIISAYVTIRYTKTTDTPTTSKVPFEPLHEWSTEEKLVGYWIDGKPVYEKTVTGTMPAASTLGNLATGSILVNENIDFAWVEKALMKDSTYVVSLPYLLTNATIIVEARINGNNLEIMNTQPLYNDKPIIAIVRYTKTTD